MAKKRNRNDKSGRGECGVVGCTNPDHNRHHYLPVSMFGDNPFYVKLCKSHHEEADKLILGKNAHSAKQAFQIIFDFVMGGIN